MTKVVRVREAGPPEVLRLEDAQIGRPGPGEARIRQTAIGLNFIDVYQRSGLYKRDLPFIPGSEGAGVVDAVGPGVTLVAPGDRVAYAPIDGAYAQERLIAADRLVKLPASIDDRTAAAIMLKGLTAQYLLRRTYKVQPGDKVLIHAAVGGVGLFLIQWAASLGAEVIGTVGSPEKAAIASAHGAKHVIQYRKEDFVSRVREITGGAGVQVVYDSVGADTYPGSLDSLATFGMWVLFGYSSGKPPAVDMARLQKGSLFATRPMLHAYTAKRADLEAGAAELFDMVGSGKLRVEINQQFSLADAAEAHRALESRKTVGSTVLVP
jgi:NADPH2:quinone reductase